MSEEVSMAERDYWRIQAQDTLVDLHACEAQLAEEHARMAALIEACAAVASFVESYDQSSTVARLLPTFYGIFRVYGKNARAAVGACQSQADAILRELEAARATLRDTIYRIEDVLEGAEIDDGIVQVSALTRLDEHYFGVLKPMRKE